MVWFKVDDRFHSHPKTSNTSLAAIGLWAVAGSWCSEHTTDGRVSEAMARSLSRGAIELAEELVAAGLWVRMRSGYRFHEWSEDRDGTKRNPTKKEVEERRQKKAEAGKKGGLASGQSRSTKKAGASARASPSVHPPTNSRSSSFSEGGSGSPPASPGGGLPANHAVDSPPNGEIPDPDRRKELAQQARAQIRKKSAPARDPFAPPPDKAGDALAALNQAVAGLPSPQPEEAPDDHD